MIHQRQSFPQVPGRRQRIEKLILNDAIYPLCLAVVRGIAVFGHTDTYMVRLEMRDILIATVLYTTISGDAGDLCFGDKL